MPALARARKVHRLRRRAHDWLARHHVLAHDQSHLHRRSPREPDRHPLQCDLLLIAGDISFAFKGDPVAKQAFLANELSDWLDRVPAKDLRAACAGNHDQSIEAWGLPGGLRCHYLQDAGVELSGLKLWGSPWQPWFNTGRSTRRGATARRFSPRSSR